MVIRAAAALLTVAAPMARWTSRGGGGGGGGACTTVTPVWLRPWRWQQAHPHPQLTCRRAVSGGASTTNLEDLARGLPLKRRKAYNLLADPPNSSTAEKETKQKGKKKKRKGKKKHKVARDMLTATQTKDMFLLSERDLQELPATERPNPKNDKFAPMRLFCTAEVVECALQVHGGPEEFLRAALAAKRKTNNSNNKQQQLSKTKQTQQRKKTPAVAAAAVEHQPNDDDDAEEILDVPLYVIAGVEEENPAMRRRFHFLMQFTTYPLLRDEKLALQIWLERFVDRGAVLEFPHLPDCMRPEIEIMSSRPATSVKTVQGLLPPASTLWDGTDLQLQDDTSRERARAFISRGIPNKNECRLLDDLLQNPVPELTEFPHLFLYEWIPSTMVGQGDAVFADGSGRLAVVEAKAKSGGNSHVRRQSEYYAQRLREEYPEAKVSEAILTNDGFAWLTMPTTVPNTDERPSMALVEASSPDESSSSSSTAELESKHVEQLSPDGSSSSSSTTVLESKHVEQQESEPSVEPSRLLAPSRLDQLEAMVVDRELKPLLRFYGLLRSGRKADLVERIYQHEQEHGVAGGF